MFTVVWVVGVAQVEPEPVVILSHPVQVHQDQFVVLVAFAASHQVLSGFCTTFLPINDNIQTEKEKMK